MTISPETIICLQALVQNDPVLLKRLRTAPDLAAAAQILITAAAAHDIMLDAGGVRMYFDDAIAAGRREALSESELDGVVGGNMNAIMTLIFGVAGCAGIRI